MKHKKPVVYIASPYTKGDQALNTRFQMEIFDKMLTDGIVTPIAPLMSHFQHLLFPRVYSDWVAYDNEIIKSCCDACLAADASYLDFKKGSVMYRETESSGRDAEVKLFDKLERPVFWRLEALYEWAKNQ